MKPGVRSSTIEMGMRRCSQLVRFCAFAALSAGCIQWIGSGTLQAQAVPVAPAEPSEASGLEEVTATPPGPDTTADTTTTPVAPPPATPAPAAPEPDNDFHLSVGGGMILLYVQPLDHPPTSDGKNLFEVFEAKLRIDAEFKRFGLHIVPIIRDTKERGFFPSTAWVQEAYAFGKAGPVTIKVGKVWRQFGRFWDNSFYGNAQEYDGLKLDPDHGVSVEGLLGADQRAGLQFFGQFFIMDGTTNYSLPGRDTQSFAGAHRRNQLVGRVEPFLKLGSLTTLKLGLSGEYFQADLPDPVGKRDVSRIAVDATAIIGGLTVWGEFTKQFGVHTIVDPMQAFPGQGADRIEWLMFGGEYTLGLFTLRYNFNQGNYLPLSYKETRHVPGVAVALNEHLMVLLEWAFAQSHVSGNTTLITNALFLTIHGKV